MISIANLTIKPHKANAIDKRAIANLRPHLLWEIEEKNLNISKYALIDESNYAIIEIDGYENIIFVDPNENSILETIQPIDRQNDKLYPIQGIEIKPQYKRY